MVVSSNFDARAIAQKVKAGMSFSQVVEVLGQPTKTKSENGLEEWFYTYEFPDKSGQDKWMILEVDFKNGKALEEGFWLPSA